MAEMSVKAASSEKGSSDERTDNCRYNKHDDGLVWSKLASVPRLDN